MKIKGYECPVCGTKFKFYKELMGDESAEEISKKCMFKMNAFMKHKKIKDDVLYNSISSEKKQKFLDCIHEGKTVGESYKEAGITQEEGFVVLDYSIENVYYLRSEPKTNINKTESKK